nr:hypothetical protein [Tanacetum cinerariifolium]
MGVSNGSMMIIDEESSRTDVICQFRSVEGKVAQSFRNNVV